MRDGYTNGLVTYGGDRRIFGTQGDSFQVREGFFLLDELRQSGKSFPMAGKDAGFGLTVTLNRVRIIAAGAGLLSRGYLKSNPVCSPAIVLVVVLEVTEQRSYAGRLPTFGSRLTRSWSN